MNEYKKEYIFAFYIVITIILMIIFYNYDTKVDQKTKNIRLFGGFLLGISLSYWLWTMYGKNMIEQKS